MSQIIKKFIGADQVGAGKIDLENNAFLRGRNAADLADVNILKVDASDQIALNSAAPLVPDIAGSGSIGLPAQAFDELNVNDVNTTGVYVYSDLATTIDLSLGTDIVIDGDPASGLELTLDAAIQTLALHTADNANNDAVETAPIRLVSGTKTTGTAASGYVEILTGNSDLGSTGPIYLETGLATAGLSGDVYLSSGGAVDADSRGSILVNAKRLALSNGMVQFQVLAADPTDITYQQGDMYFNSASNRVRVYTGSVWQDLGDGAAANVPVWGKENLTLNATDISNGYKDLDFAIEAQSLDVVTEGVVQIEGLDYTVNLTGGTGGVTRVTWSGNWASIIADGDVVVFKYQYMAP